MSQPHRLGDLQHAILRVLWDRGEATVAEVHRALDDRGLATTTIATMLTKMEKKGVVTHRTEQRRFIYRAAIVEGEVHRGMVRDLVERAFDGSPSALVHHLLTEGEIEDDELDVLRAMIDRRERRDRHES